MKIFIAGARSVTSLSNIVQSKLMSIYEKECDVLVGDCYGVDTAVQEFFVNIHYNNVTVFASNGKARNNIGNWNVENVHVDSSVKGFDFYKQKDIAMANSADYGFMIWDGRSKGTLNNIVNLINQNKKVLVYLSVFDKMFVISDNVKLNALINICPSVTKTTYTKLLNSQSYANDGQMSLFH